MKTSIKFFACSLLLLINACATQPPTNEALLVPNKLIGLWEGKDHTGNQSGFRFNADNSADVIVQGESFAKKIADSGAIKYTVSERNGAMNILVVAEEFKGERIVILNMLAAFADENTLKIKMNRDQSTPKAFPDNNTGIIDKAAIVLKRIR